MPILFSQIKLRDITLKNRLVMSPMCQYTAEDGFANDFHLVHYGSRALGGTGLIIQEATAVLPEGRITPGDLGIWDDANIPKLAQIVRFIENYGAVPGIQLAHAGRKASCAKPWHGGKQIHLSEGGWQTVSASNLAFDEGERPPLQLLPEGIKNVVFAFKAAARRAHKAGYKLIEIHGAHGYLIHQFLSPLANKRTDHYGGSFENRIRLLLEIVEAIRSEWPANLPLIVRLSATDYVDGGWDLDQTVKLASILKDHGVDMIDTSSGGMVPYAKIPFGPGYQVQFAERIRKEAGIMTGAVGLITNAQQAEEILSNEQADLIILGRQLLRDPQFPLHAAKELDVDVAWPAQYLRAKG
jgi:2,4-dienoyl-CoA reductase-like NADH-dependent reductase (Old Yellow Enzyme family)